ncbi:putative Spc97/Spc98 protein [Trachipleistophora hominis]|uniref:Putative Spc97/Spc98 protein n=1 Tax=Trachipleistophora hominis TaxID=72359 RepID=L7JUK1_TRAHO|nr:putative Spc97/Spc98 protein [Trachipleistophora hominis]
MFNLAEKLFFRKITGQSNQLPVSNATLERAVLNDVFFFLCGLNTCNIKYHDNADILVNPAYVNANVLKAVRKLGLQIKSFEKYIFENEYCSDSLKRILSNEIEEKLNQFQLFLVSLRGKVQSIEDLLIKLSDYIDLFNEMERIVNIVHEKNGDEIINVVKERKDKMVHFNTFYDNLIQRFAIDINQRINLFICHGIIKTPFFMVKESDTFNFDEKFFTNKFFLESTHVPFYLRSSKLVLECGLYSNLIRTVRASVENQDETMDLQNDFYDIMHGTPSFNQTKKKDVKITVDRIDTEVRNFNEPASNDSYHNDEVISNILPYEYVVRQHRHKYRLLNDLCLRYFENEWANIRDYLFLMNSAFFTDVLSEINENILDNSKKNVLKINRMVSGTNISFYIAKNSIITIISKILNLELNYDLDEELCILDGLSIEYKPNHVFQLFFSKKNIDELELVFRMLFTLFVINFSIVRDNRSTFSNLILTLNNFLVSSFYTNNILKEILQMQINDLNSCVSRINELIRLSLRDLYITSFNVFKILGSYFVLCFKYIKYKKEDCEGLKKVILDLNTVIDNENYNIFLANLLYRMKKHIVKE